MQKAPVAVHHRSACSGVKALRNTSAAKRQAAKPWLAFRSLDPFRALREPDRRRRDEERPVRSEQRTGNKPKRLLDRKSPIQVTRKIASAAMQQAFVGSGRDQLSAMIELRKTPIPSISTCRPASSRGMVFARSQPLPACRSKITSPALSGVHHSHENDRQERFF